MDKETKNKIKAGLIMFIIDVISTIITIYLLGFELVLTRQSIGIIALVNLVTTVVLSRFKLIEDGK